MILQIKTKFDIIHDKKNVNYYGESIRARKLFEKLLEVSENRCMYCGENLERLNYDLKCLKILGIQVEREHTVERRINRNAAIKQLTECKYNFSVSCHQCNIEKRKKVKADSQLLLNLNKKKCENTCKDICFEYKNVLESYRQNNKIIAMPLGIKNKSDIIFNTEKLLFEINFENDYSAEEEKIISNHIIKFLSKIQNECLDDVLSSIKEMNPNGKIENLPKKKTEYFNKNKFKSVVADLFLEKLTSLTLVQRKIEVDLLEKQIKRSLGVSL